MKYTYAVLGTGRQGVAAGYDLARFGDAEEVILIDSDAQAAGDAATCLTSLCPQSLFRWRQADVTDIPQLTQALKGVTTLVSAVPYQFNLDITSVAVKHGINMVDLGGNTSIVRRQLAQSARAQDAGVTIVPDCGMGPGLNISLATYVMSLLDSPQEVSIWDGGLPQHPSPPWNYLLTFNIGGLTNEYFGNAFFLRDGKLVEVPCFSGYETLDFSPLGALEAFVTSGGLSTMPWTFQGKLQRLENKTLRYLGHRDQFKAFTDLGLLDLEPLEVKGSPVVPRDVLHALLEPRIRKGEIEDIALMRVTCRGEDGGVPAEATIELVDYYDTKTGLMAMQRLTGWHSSILAILATQGKIPRGAIPVELAAPGDIIVNEAKKRGLSFQEQRISKE